MDIQEFNGFCELLPHSSYVVQWGGAHVWKIGGKFFAIGGWQKGDTFGVTFKCSAMSFQVLQDLSGCRPAPYLASRGMKWIQRISDEELDDEGLKAYLAESYRLVFAGLTKKLQNELI
jgi:predicted DNA-binding protein (MmcQ/YjbR family)